MLLTPEAPPIAGIVCEDPDDLSRLRERILVSGVRCLTYEESEPLGYATHHPFGNIVPDEPRPPTDEELERLIATETTECKIQLLELPAELGGRAIENCPPRTALNSLPSPYIRNTLVDGIEGVFLEVRKDAPQRLTTSVNSKQFSPAKNGPPYDGMHIDNWPNDDIKYLVSVIDTQYPAGQQGAPSWRYHLIAPDITRSKIGSPSSKNLKMMLMSHVKHALSSNGAEVAPLVYWLKLYGPRINMLGQLVLEAAVGTPVAKIMHDGSTWDSPFCTTSMMASISEIPAGRFPSLV